MFESKARAASTTNLYSTSVESDLWMENSLEDLMILSNFYWQMVNFFIAFTVSLGEMILFKKQFGLV